MHRYHGTTCGAVVLAAVSAMRHDSTFLTEILLACKAHEDLTTVEAILVVTAKTGKNTLFILDTVGAKRLVARRASDKAAAARDLKASSALGKGDTILAILASASFANGTSTIVTFQTLGSRAADAHDKLGRTILSKTVMLLALVTLVWRNASHAGNDLHCLVGNAISTSTTLDFLLESLLEFGSMKDAKEMSNATRVGRGGGGGTAEPDVNKGMVYHGTKFSRSPPFMLRVGTVTT
mmetsp:Transcript_30/g.56  ORF Transcript_30/g.56 Transcript_30/m.56 type:complete len:237 (-) Transcript_30:421-1131(-)